jgi:hypothetical protein
LSGPPAGALHHAIAGTAGVAAVTPPAASPDGKITTMIVFPAAKPQDAATQDLVGRLRTSVLPPLAHQTGAHILVGGTAAATVDFADAVASRLPLFIGVVIGLSALLLLSASGRDAPPARPVFASAWRHGLGLELPGGRTAPRGTVAHAGSARTRRLGGREPVLSVVRPRTWARPGLVRKTFLAMPGWS